jgi:hypothetical protein
MRRGVWVVLGLMGMAPLGALARAPGEQVFVGMLKAVEKDRLRMVDPSGRVYEFGLSDQARIIGPSGAAMSRQALREGVPVRTVTRAGETENQVLTLQVMEQAPAQAP